MKQANRMVSSEERPHIDIAGNNDEAAKAAAAVPKMLKRTTSQVKMHGRCGLPHCLGASGPYN
jgi:hypothetical protein